MQMRIRFRAAGGMLAATVLFFVANGGWPAPPNPSAGGESDASRIAGKEIRPMNYDAYLDKVYGCWLGKCIAGTIGAPYEGAKELLDIEYTPALIEQMLPNDDLDLQVLWLSVLEEKGTAFTSDDLADAFLNRCPYAPGEYAYFWMRDGGTPGSQGDMWGNKNYSDEDPFLEFWPADDPPPCEYFVPSYGIKPIAVEGGDLDVRD